MSSRRSVWIVSHFEYLGPPYWLDECVMFLGSSRKAALKYVRVTIVDPGTWWSVRPYRIDARDAEQGPAILYGRTLRVMKRGYSLKRALKLSRKLRARNAALYRKVQQARKKKGGTK